MTDVFAYLRVSDPNVRMNTSGLERQAATLEAFAKTKGYSIVQTFTERYTGTDLDNRPAFRDMREALLSNGVRIVIVEKLDRVARDVMIQEAIIKDFLKHGIQLVSAEPGEDDVCSTDPTRKFIRQVLGSVAELDRSMLVRRMREGKRRTGRWGGKRRYGMNPGEVAAVNRIYFLRRQGFNASRIAEVLNAESIPTRGGGEWFPNTVARILRRKAA